MAKFFRFSFNLVVYAFAIIGFVLVGGFFAVKYGLTKTAGEVDQNSKAYDIVATELKNNVNSSNSNLYQKEISEKILLCRINLVSDYYPMNAKTVLDHYESNYDLSLTSKMLLALDLRLKGDEYDQKKNNCNEKSYYSNVSVSSLREKLNNIDNESNAFLWVNGEEWNTIKAAISKDKDKISLASQSSDFDSRMLVSACIVEQERLYHTQREEYEKIFKPLSILGNANKMAWGVMSIKEATAIQIENNLKDKTSSYYLGQKYENLLDFQTNDTAKERYDRLTNEKDHYYSYLYGSLYMKQLANQWKVAGFDISNRPEILATLFNLGFEKSKPKLNPEVGGSIIELKDAKYTFGSLAYEFYYSGELESDYPLTD